VPRPSLSRTWQPNSAWSGDVYSLGGMKNMADSVRTADLSLSEDLLQEIKKRVVYSFAPEKVILFGSYAERRATPESDVDLLVVMERPLSRKERQARIRGLFRDVPLPVQVITISKQEFEETRDVIGGIAYPAAKYGSVIYEKP